MSDVGLSPRPARTRYPHQISGGQRQRSRSSPAPSPPSRSLLIADESRLRPRLSVQAQIINLLNALRIKRGFSQIVISHDLAVVSNTCDQIIVMKDGDIVEAGSVTHLLDNPSHPYTKRLIAAAPAL